MNNYSLDLCEKHPASDPEEGCPSLPKRGGGGGGGGGKRLDPAMANNVLSSIRTWSSLFIQSFI
jgi:hypothetical protein